MENENLQNSTIELVEKIKTLEEQIYFLQNEDNLYDKVLTVINNIDAIVIIYDIETYNIIFINTYVSKLFGTIGNKKCYEFLHGNEIAPCLYCPNDRLFDEKGNPAGIYVWESLNEKNNRWYENHTQVVRLKEKLYKLEISYDITHRKKDEKRILKLLNQQNVLFDIARRLNSHDSFESNLSYSFQLIGKQLNASRVYILELSENKNITNIINWNLNSKFERIDEIININLTKNDFPFDELLNLGRIKFVEYEKKISKKFRDILINNSIYANLLVPIIIDDKLIALLGLDDCVEKRMWHSLEISYLKTIAELIANVYKRNIYEKEILENQQKLREANAAKDKFFSIIAHDLKNPVYNLISLSEFLIKNIDTWKLEKIKEFVIYINETSKQGFNLLENLLVWARSQTGKLENNPTNFKINNIINENIDLHKNLALNKKIEIKNCLNSESIINADLNMISTVIRNLISNAIKYTNENGTINIYSEDFNENDKLFQKIIIQDSGVGIKQKDIDKLFVIDNNFSTPGTNEEKGTGLGLILCSEFIKINHGRIWVESEYGIGSKFIFTIPQIND